MCERAPKCVSQPRWAVLNQREGSDIWLGISESANSYNIARLFQPIQTNLRINTGILPSVGKPLDRDPPSKTVRKRSGTK